VWLLDKRETHYTTYSRFGQTLGQTFLALCKNSSPSFYASSGTSTGRRAPFRAAVSKHCSFCSVRIYCRRHDAPPVSEGATNCRNNGFGRIDNLFSISIPLAPFFLSSSSTLLYRPNISPCGMPCDLHNHRLRNPSLPLLIPCLPWKGVFRNPHAY